MTIKWRARNSKNKYSLFEVASASNDTFIRRLIECEWRVRLVIAIRLPDNRQIFLNFWHSDTKNIGTIVRWVASIFLLHQWGKPIILISHLYVLLHQFFVLLVHFLIDLWTYDEVFIIFLADMPMQVFVFDVYYFQMGF